MHFRDRRFGSAAALRDSANCSMAGNFLARPIRASIIARVSSSSDRCAGSMPISPLLNIQLWRHVITIGAQMRQPGAKAFERRDRDCASRSGSSPPRPPSSLPPRHGSRGGRWNRNPGTDRLGEPSERLAHQSGLDAVIVKPAAGPFPDAGPRYPSPRPASGIDVPARRYATTIRAPGSGSSSWPAAKSGCISARPPVLGKPAIVEIEVIQHLRASLAC